MLISFDPAFKMVFFRFDIHFARNSPFGVGTRTDYFSFFIFLLVGLVYFFYETLSKKVDPIFADRFAQCGRPILQMIFLKELRDLGC